MASPKKLLILSHDVIGRQMAGPGMRYLALAQALSINFDVKLAVRDGASEDIARLSKTYNISATSYTEQSFKELFNGSDCVYGQELTEDMLIYAHEHDIKIIIDLYAPVPVEFVASKHFSPTGFGSLEQIELRNLNARYAMYLRYGDYFTCSNERQRDFWIGFMMASGSYHHGSIFDSLESLFGIVPMGISATPPKQSKKVLKGAVDGIDANDFVLLWTGGLWDWFDPLMAVKAVEQARISNPKIKLVFMGFRHPNKKVPHMRAAKDTLAYVKKRGLENTAVFFVESWVAYEDRIDYLLEADAAIYTHKSSMETRFSHRTRVLDHLYTSLPTIATRGDYLADELIDPQNLGIVCESSIDSAAGAIIELVDDPELYNKITDNISNYRPHLYWNNVTKPLVAFMKQTNSPREKSLITPIEPSRPKKQRNILRRFIRKVRQHVR